LPIGQQQIAITNQRNTQKGQFYCLKIYLDTDLKTILLDYQNNYIGYSNWMLELRRNFKIMFEIPT